ncbi:MAG: ParB/RepB/Spo0J family partition protein [Candidatus Odinarchaeota archaeon]
MSEEKKIPVDDITIDTTQARRGGWEDDDKDKTLIDSIKGIGLIYDIIVRPTNSKKYGGKTDKPYALVAGSRRLNALIRAGITEIPCKIMDLTDTEAIAMSFSENIGRKNLTEHQKMITILTWIDLLMNTKYTEEEIIKTINMIELEKDYTEKEIDEKILQKRRTMAIHEIADTCFGGMTGPIYQLLQVQRLPKELQILMKKPEERTEAERLILKEYDIKSDFRMNYQTLSVVEKIFDHLGKILVEEKIGKIFEIIRDFSLEEKTIEKQYEILGSIRDKLIEKKTFEIVMTEVKEEHDIHAPSMSQIPSVAFKLPPEYSLWHTNALNRANMKTAELVRTVYLEWLEKEAKREGW